LFLFEIRNNKLDQPQGMSVKMAANWIRTHAAPTRDDLWKRGSSNP